MTAPVAATRPALPDVSFGPFRLLEAVPWLLVAATMRVIAFAGGLIALPAIMLANIALLLAFVIVTWRMVLATDGRSGLGLLGRSQQIGMARAVLPPIFGLLLTATAVAAVTGLTGRPGEFMLGFDGIAFDQASHAGRLWSALVAALVLLMVLQVDEASKPSLLRAIRRFGDHARWLIPGVLLVAVVAVLLHPIQGYVRGWVTQMWQDSPLPVAIKSLLSMVFIFSFATVRLWLTVGILVFALRQSYRAQPGA
ncbi:hypothetical protein [Bosea sp. (in: a-proteobacteria)]|uniref:hypothetical protein n=1 Tax=Bosea sp. (in: a-proteobacteria) TaxID=1871050 RepID=UPI003F719C20